MKTITMRTVGVILSAGVLMTSCVSSKKYHASQAAVAKLQADSSNLAQQVSTLNQNVSSLEQKNSDLQKNVETANSTNSGLQKNVAYYTDYAGKQQASNNQIKDELTSSLSAAGLSSSDFMEKDGKIYINIGEKSLFKGNSAMLTAKGKELVDNLGQYVKGHEQVDVSVADLQMATSGEAGETTTTTMDASSMNNGSSASTGSSATRNNDDANTGAPKKAKHSVAVHHAKKAPAATGESKSVAYSAKHRNKYSSERMNRSTARAIAWKRQNVVSEALLKNGIPKVKLVSQLPNGNNTANTSPKGVQVVLVNDMDNFYKHMTETPTTGQPVSVNP
ncbi:MAG: hypothetical protein QM726_00750 [Chitinophagaceae bacterium]